MSEQIEIEFKNLLTQDEYRHLIKHFNLTNVPPIFQENIYLDTPDFKLKQHHAALRVRIKEHQQSEITLKTPIEKGLLETNIPLTTEECLMFMTDQQLPEKKELEMKLKTFGMNHSSVDVFASLKTKRIEKQLTPDILIVLDESWYHGQHDVELEIEASNYEDGERFFLTLLAQHHIPRRHTPNKIQRAMQAKLNP
ncbi:CYTH domain-containing protein [Vagococcus xieshaowenii]|uniref:CYTH domain-containing protein n=1 Tax=Vagococcus xieshaowenii TaxID=2562451 RepID=A0AAJ5EFA9_9ENTE|nr:CYTH domain-containing protein [Vagococcus xieshaowenii]QCA28006.1 CYTH domain-containing protein [Vagococcus xieshaowenii]TFZ41227.1 CYTH domain-containing protein [Vagococcus xieshaowenii]